MSPRPDDQRPASGPPRRCGGGDGRINNPHQYSFSRGLTLHPPFNPRHQGCGLQAFALSPRSIRPVLRSSARECTCVHNVSSINPREIGPVMQALLTHGACRAMRAHSFPGDHTGPSRVRQSGHAVGKSFSPFLSNRSGIAGRRLGNVLALGSASGQIRRESEQCDATESRRVIPAPCPCP
jgi:hypothetical protein